MQWVRIIKCIRVCVGGGTGSWTHGLYTVLFLIFNFLFWDGVLLNCPGGPQTLPQSSGVLGLPVWATMLLHLLVLPGPLPLVIKSIRSTMILAIFLEHQVENVKVYINLFTEGQKMKGQKREGKEWSYRGYNKTNSHSYHGSIYRISEVF